VSTTPEPDDRLSGYLDGELDPAERAAVDSFLAQSDAWRNALTEVQWARDTVRALPWHDAPAGFWDDLALESLGATAPHRWRHPFRVLAGAAAAAAVVTAFVVPLEDPDSQNGGGGSTAARSTATSSPDRSTVKSGSGGGSGDDTNLLQDMVNVALDPFDW
jgi:ferric-dicitrate binding protein FerR (iron transport regulator)